MIQVLQDLQNGDTLLSDVPRPRATATSVVVATRASVLSVGTERMLLDFGRGNWLDKARAQPDKVKQVLAKISTDGLGATIDAVRAKLATPIPLGYCQAGIVVDVGARVFDIPVGARVVTNGPHAEYVRVSRTLMARIPNEVPFDVAAFTPLAAIGLQGLRLAQPTLGETVVVYGLGLIGLLTVQLARAAGCRVIGIDRVESRGEMARRFGAEAIITDDAEVAARAVLERTEGGGADAVLLTLSTSADEPVHAAATMSRKRGRVVLIGVTGLGLRRDDFYRKELSLQVSCSYGPGRYDPLHEEQGVDYPLPFVRWTEGRNFDAVLALMADGRVDPRPLISHRFAIADAVAAYDAIGGITPGLGVVLEYDAPTSFANANSRTVVLRPAAAVTSHRPRIGVLGAGNFASRVLVPAFREAGAEAHVIVSSGGVSAAVVGRQQGFHEASTDTDAVVARADVDVIVVATRHDAHAGLTVRALEAGKHVFVEKPLAMTHEQLDAVRGALVQSRGVLTVGFNRRFAPLVRKSREMMAGRGGPLAVVITVNAGAIPHDHWTQDRESGGGRIVGEACHFIDLARHLVGASIRDLDVVAARDHSGRPLDDIANMQLAFADGSIASVQYLANGHKSYPKERIELFADGRVVRIDNFRRLESWGCGKVPGLPGRQDKGHARLVAAFLAAVRGQAPPPIPVDEVLEVSHWAIVAAERALGGASPTGDA